MDDRYNYYYRQGSGLWRTLRDGDFDESDVWDTIKDNRDSNNNTSDYGFPTFNETKYRVSSKHVPSAAKMIPRASSSSSSSSNPTPEPKKIYQKSAPVNVPNWSKLQRQKSKKISRNARWQDDDDDDDDDDEDGHDGDDDDEEDEYEDDGDGDGDGGYDMRLPPHEYIAMRLARSQISSFSVFEGAGRTLKGRDLSKMRNAVLTKTGFLESP